MHPERASAVGEQDSQFWKVDGDVIYVNRIAVLVASAGKDRSAGVKHDRDTVGFGGAIDDLQLIDPSQVIVRKEQLVWRVNLDHLNVEPQQLFHVCHDV